MFLYEKNFNDRDAYPYQHVGVLNQHPYGLETVLTTGSEGYAVGEAVKLDGETGAVTLCGAADKPAFIMAEAVKAADNTVAKSLKAYRVIPGSIWRVGVDFSASATAIAVNSKLQIEATAGLLVTDVVKSGTAASYVYGVAKVVDVLDANTAKEDGDEILVTFD